VEINLNGKKVNVTSSEDTPLLWVIRDELNLTGTKFGCGQAQCGACTVHIDGNPVRSCALPLKLAKGDIVTIEGMNDKVSNAVQKAWVDNHVPQCGYCQIGNVMTATALLKETPKPSDKDIDNAMAGHICRCGTYQRIRAAIHQAAKDIA
jgi:isoquinoline 1-oxidoreductase alpha subunit